jgi:branched-chain amino acid transport system substrate-binding protein
MLAPKGPPVREMPANGGNAMIDQLSRRALACLGAGFLAAATAGIAPASAQTANPIRIGFGMALTGPLAPNGKSALLAMQIWEETVNAKGGLLGRPVKLVYYDDQSNPSNVPALYTKLLDVDKVDLIVGGYATNMIAPALPIAIARNKVFIGLIGLAVNAEFGYPRYFAMHPAGPNPKAATTRGFFEIAMAQNPKPQTVAIVAADAEFARNASDGARENAQKAGLRIVYDRTYPPNTTDYGPIVRAIQATNADLVAICSYPLETVGFIRAINEIGYKPKMIGGGMVGTQATAIKMQLGPLLNGIVNYDFWVPAPTMQFPGVMELIKTYQERAGKEGVDALGYYMAPWAFAYLQVLRQAIEGTKSIDDGKLADFLRANTFKTVVGDIRFGDKGELAVGRTIQTQFQGIKGNDLDQFRNISAQVILAPAELKSGDVIYPYEKARQ